MSRLGMAGSGGRRPGASAAIVPRRPAGGEDDTVSWPFRPPRNAFLERRDAPGQLPPPVSFPYGAAHEFELPFLGDSFNRTLLPLTPGEKKLSATMIDYWTQFSGEGSPNRWSTPLWLPYVPLVGDFSEFVPATPFMSTKFQSFHKTTFWTELAGLGGLDLKRGGAAARALGVHPRFITLQALVNAAHKREMRLKGQ